MLNKVMLEKKSRICACAVLWQWDIFDAVKLLVDTDNKGHLLIPSFFNIWSHVPSSPSAGFEKCQQSREEQIVEMSVCRGQNEEISTDTLLCLFPNNILLIHKCSNLQSSCNES